MSYLGTIRVVPELPEEIKRLEELAYNLYFSWTPEARELFRTIDKELWRDTNHNPVKFLREIQQKKLEKFATDPQFLSLFKKVMVEYDQYLDSKHTWFQKTFPDEKNKTIAYFSAEFGFHESIPIYAGGLGVLAGDHLKSASDLGVPLIGVSLFYHQTYFSQQIDAQGKQIAMYDTQIPDELPLKPVLNKDGTPVTIEVEVAAQIVKVRIWKVHIGRIVAYLLDTNLPENSAEGRKITARLYGGDQEMRISQEIVLGMGGVRALKSMGIYPDAWHMNEGHSVFLALERIGDFVKAQTLNFDEALQAVKNNTIFTTHTPVPAGNDAFPLHIKDKYFQRYWQELGIKRHEFMELGSQVQPEGYEIFNLTILSLKLSQFRNGVSRMHGDVSKKLWSDVWHNIPREEIPISYITNGVHAMTWIVFKTRKLFDDYLGTDWKYNIDNPSYWRAVHEIPDEILWKTKLEIKEKMLRHLRERLALQYTRNKVGTLQLRRLENMLNPNILTIGFARRFATYKRGTLIFRDLARLKRILTNPDKPVQIVFAGKAHPRDEGGQALISHIYQLSQSDELRGRVFFVEGYDLHLARDLISGMDLWLNTPRRPQEASGTSGQKVTMNFGINFSVLDGWWCEGYNGKNGWAFGDREDYRDLEELDTWDSDAIYDILENDIIPLYYDKRKENIPNEWIQVMKHSLVANLPQFNTHRMVKDYTERFYISSIQNSKIFSENKYKRTKEFAQWLKKIEEQWPSLYIRVDSKDPQNYNYVLKYKEPLQVKAQVYLNSISPDEVKVQVYIVQENKDPLQDKQFETVDMKMTEDLGEGKYNYEATIAPSDSGNYKFTLRMLPNHPYCTNPVEISLIRWLNDKL
jgi:starch phosphorylase